MRPRSVTFSRPRPRIEIKISAILGRFSPAHTPAAARQRYDEIFGRGNDAGSGTERLAGRFRQGVQAGGEELHQPRSKLDDSLPRA
jgi:hypothetical protein